MLTERERERERERESEREGGDREREGNKESGRDGKRERERLLLFHENNRCDACDNDIIITATTTLTIIIRFYSNEDKLKRTMPVQNLCGACLKIHL